MNLWPVEHYCPHLFSRSALIWTKSEEKVFNWSEVHFYRSSFLQNPYFSRKMTYVTSVVSSTLLKGGVISEGIFSLVHTQKNKQITVLSKKLRDSDLIYLFEDGPNWKYLLRLLYLVRFKTLQIVQYLSNKPYLVKNY